MRCLGIDLAWGDRGRTGLAELDVDGRLIRSASVRSDAEIAEFIGTDAAPVVAAIDAPLVVTNPTGQRECEREVARAFGRFHAAPHPSNLSRPVFSPEPRAMRLARRFGWTVDPAVPAGVSPGCAIEVYPHPAMVSLFGLSKVIPYKGKPGRTVESRRDAVHLLLRLMADHLDEVLRLRASDRWGQLVRLAAGASRPVDLAVIEDEIDAIFCAHLAWLWATEPSRLVVFGDGPSGFIVTLPAPGSAPARPQPDVTPMR